MLIVWRHRMLWKRGIILKLLGELVHHTLWKPRCDLSELGLGHELWMMGWIRRYKLGLEEMRWHNELRVRPEWVLVVSIS